MSVAAQSFGGFDCPETDFNMDIMDTEGGELDSLLEEYGFGDTPDEMDEPRAFISAEQSWRDAAEETTRDPLDYYILASDASEAFFDGIEDSLLSSRIRSGNYAIRRKTVDARLYLHYGDIKAHFADELRIKELQDEAFYKFISFLQLGKTYQWIADAIGVSLYSVKYWLRSSLVGPEYVEPMLQLWDATLCGADWETLSQMRMCGEQGGDDERLAVERALALLAAAEAEPAAAVEAETIEAIEEIETAEAASVQDDADFSGVVVVVAGEAAAANLTDYRDGDTRALRQTGTRRPIGRTDDTFGPPASGTAPPNSRAHPYAHALYPNRSGPPGTRTHTPARAAPPDTRLCAA